MTCGSRSSLRSTRFPVQTTRALSRRKLLSTVLAVMTFAVVWLVVSPAQAMAPLCDPRGAIVFAPPPQIQDEELSLDIPADCVDINPLETKNYERGCPVHFDFSTSQQPAMRAALTLPDAPFVERLSVRRDEEARPPPGVRGSIERPPRV